MRNSMDFSIINDFKAVTSNRECDNSESHYLILSSKLNDFRNEVDNLKKKVSKL